MEIITKTSAQQRWDLATDPLYDFYLEKGEEFELTFCYMADHHKETGRVRYTGRRTTIDNGFEKREIPELAALTNMSEGLVHDPSTPCYPEGYR